MMFQSFHACSEKKLKPMKMEEDKSDDEDGNKEPRKKKKKLNS